MSTNFSVFENAKQFLVELVTSDTKKDLFLLHQKENLKSIILQNKSIAPILVDYDKFDEFAQQFIVDELNYEQTLQLEKILIIIQDEINRSKSANGEKEEKEEEGKEEDKKEESNNEAEAEGDEDDDGEEKGAEKLVKFFEQFSYKKELSKGSKELVDKTPILASIRDSYFNTKLAIQLRWKQFVEKVNGLSELVGLPLLVLAILKLMEKSFIFETLVKSIGTVIFYTLVVAIGILMILRYVNNPMKGLKTLKKQFKFKLPTGEDDDDSG